MIARPRRLKLATLSLLCMLGAAAALAAADPKAARLYEDALTRFEKRDVTGAIVQLKNALQIDKSMLPVHVLLGKALLANSEVGAAEVAFTEALRLGVDRAEVVVPLARAVIAQGKQQQVLEQQRFSPAGLPPDTRAKLMLLRASAYADLGDATNAMKAVEEARALDGGSADSWLAEVPVRIRARQYVEAAAAADRAIELAPSAAEAQYLRGTVAHVQGDVPAALAAYGRALQLDPAHTEALVSRAGLLIDQGRIADASRDATELLRTSASDPRGFYLRSLVAERQGDSTASKSALNSITALLDPVPIETLRYRSQALMLGGLAHYGLGQLEKAKPYLEAVLRTQPGSGVAKLLAQIYLGDKNTNRAIETLDNYLRVQPGDTQAMLLLASAHMAQGRHSRASQLMQDALKLQDRADLKSMLGMGLAGGGKYADASTAFEAAYRKDPGQLQAGVALAALYMQSGQAAKSVAVAESLAKQRPTSPGVQNLLGSALARQGNTKGARAAFEAATKLDPAFVAPQINLARLDVDAKAWEAATARLNAVLARDEKNTDALTELGRMAETRGQLADAQRWLQKAEDVSPTSNLQPGLALVDFHLRHGQGAAALEAARRLSGRAPDAVPVLMAVARANLAVGDVNAARSALARAGSLVGYNPSALVQIALLQLGAGHLAGAAYSLDKALADRPDFVPAQALLAEIEIRQREFAKAETRVRGIIAKNPKLGVGYGLQGDLAVARGQRPAAVDAYRRAHQIEQSSASLLRLHGALAATDAPAANQLAEQWLKQHPRDVPVRRSLADSYARTGNLAAARSAYESLIEITPDNAEVLNNLANVLLLANDPGALKVAEKALTLSPGTPHILGTTGWAAYKAGQNDRALQLLRDARLRDPSNPETHYFLGSVLASTGRKTEAREELEAALKGGVAFAGSKDAEQLLRTLK